MSPSFPLNLAWIAALIISGLVIVLPLLLALVAHRRLGVSWRYFGFGVVIFFLFEVITHLWWGTPSVILGWAGGSEALLIALLFGWALSSGLCEEVGRYVGYRAFMGREEKTWSKAVMYGIGHGGLETMITGVGALVPLVGGLSFTAQPMLLTTALAVAWARVWATPFHIALSVVVLQVFRRKNIGWLWVAILAHTAYDFTLFMMFYALNASLVGNSLWAVYGVIALWAIWKLRDRSTEASASVEPKPLEPGATMG